MPAAPRSLRTKWTLALLVVGAVPLAAFGLASTRIQRAGLESAEKSLQVAVIDQVGEAIDRAYEEAAEATHRAGAVLVAADTRSEDARLNDARDAVARARSLSQVAIYGSDGRLIDAISRDASAAKIVPPAQLELTEGSADDGWSAPNTNPAGVLTRRREALTRDGATVAWVIGTPDPRLLERITTEISQRHFGRPDRIVVVDAQLRILAPSSALVGRSLAGKELFVKNPLPSAAFAGLLALTGEFNSDDGEAMVGSLRTSPTHRWAVLVRRPRREAFAALADARRALWLAGLAFAMAALIGGAVIASFTTRPVRELVALTLAYGRREFTARSHIRTGDELEQLGASLSRMADDLASGEAELERRAGSMASLSRYLPAEVARAIVEGRQRLSLGGERREVSVLFADVVAFTSFAEGAPPERVVAFLNELFTVLTEVVFRHGGTVDKFIGDCVMAVFGAPDEQADHAMRALSAAEDMHRFIAASAAAWQAKYDVAVKIAVGVNSGVALVGNLGSATRMEYTAIGDVVNVAARLEGLARPGQTLVTEEVVRRVGDAFSFGSLGVRALRGKSQAIEILELQ